MNVPYMFYACHPMHDMHVNPLACLLHGAHTCEVHVNMHVIYHYFTCTSHTCNTHALPNIHAGPCKHAHYMINISSRVAYLNKFAYLNTFVMELTHKCLDTEGPMYSRVVDIIHLIVPNFNAF